MLSQNAIVKVDITKNMTVDGVFDLIMDQTDYKFIYQEGLFKDFPKIQIKKGKITANELLKKSLANGSFDVAIKGKNMVVIEKSKKIVERQRLEINGTVKDLGGQPLPGTNIIEKGTTNGTQTDFDGKFTITVAGTNSELEVSFVGFRTQTVAVNNETNLSIILEEESEGLEELVIVGYGKRKKSYITGAVAKISGRSIAGLQSSRVDEALQGKLAGVRVQNVDGQPGAPPKVQVRAGGSITGAGNPLIVVDGFPITGDLSTINPSDIESIEVLKDASSAAIYGSRAASGVIMVTTKKGSRFSKPQFRFKHYSSSAEPYRANLKFYTTLDEHIANIEANTDINNGVVTSSTGWPTEATLGVEGYDQLFIKRLQLYKETSALGLEQNYQDNVFQTGLTQNYDFNVRGGSEKAQYFASLGNLDSEETIAKSDFERYSGRINLDVQLTDKLKGGFSFNGIVSERSLFPDIGFTLADAMRTQSFVPKCHTTESIAIVQAHDAWLINNGYAGTNQGSGPDLADLQPGDFAHEWHWNRWQTIRPDINGNDYAIPNRIGLSFNNGATAKIKHRNKTLETFFANVFAYFDYELIDGLNLKTNLAADFNDFSTFENLETPASESGIGGTLQNESDRLTTSWLSQNTVTYNKEIKKHTFDLLGGYEFGKQRYKALFVNGNEYSADGLFTFGSLRDVQTSNFLEFITRKSILFRAGYVYDDRFLLSASYRRDGDSRFGANNQWADFPAVSIGWNVHNESFFNFESISRLKLRASYGKLGSTEGLGAYDALSSLQSVTTTLGGSNAIGFTNSNVANPNLSWQITSEQNYGFDLGLLNNRFSLGIDYFVSETENMLLQKGISAITGFTSTTVNQGSLENKGIEVELSANVINAEDLTWSLSGNISSVDTKVTDTANENGFSLQPDARLPEFRTYAGGQISEFWGYETTGREIEEKFLLTPGYPINGTHAQTYVVDQNGDGKIDSDDFVKLGSNAPEFTWGLSSDFRYKNVDASFVFKGSHGAEVANTDDFFFGAHWKGTLNSSFPEEELSQLGDKTKSDLFIQDASFVALRNLTIGYTFKNRVYF